MSNFKNGPIAQRDGAITGSKSQKGHCGKFWWVYLLVLVVIVVIVVPVIILVAIPKIAQQKVNAAELHVDSIVVSQTTPTKLNMAINSSITTDGSVHVTIAGFEGTFYLEDVDPPLAFATIQFPRTSSDSLVLVNISQEVILDDYLDAVTIFNTHLLQQDSVKVRITGDTSVRVKGIARDYPVSFSKEVDMAGFSGFKGISVENPRVKLGDVNNFNATAHIPNPTIWTIEVGNTTFHNYFNGTEIGTAYILDVVLRPGDNEFFLWADVDQAPILSALASRPYCETGEIALTLTGKSVMNHGQNITYLADALAASNATANVNVGDAVKNDIGIDIPCPTTNATAKSLKRV